MSTRTTPESITPNNLVVLWEIKLGTLNEDTQFETTSTMYHNWWEWPKPLKKDDYGISSKGTITLKEIIAQQPSLTIKWLFENIKIEKSNENFGTLFDALTAALGTETLQCSVIRNTWMWPHVESCNRDEFVTLLRRSFKMLWTTQGSLILSEFYEWTNTELANTLAANSNN